MNKILQLPPKFAKRQMLNYLVLRVGIRERIQRADHVHLLTEIMYRLCRSECKRRTRRKKLKSMNKNNCLKSRRERTIIGGVERL